MTSASGNKPAGGMIRVAVVDDSPALRRHLDKWLARTAGFNCTGCCGSGAEALRLVPEWKPDVVLMDVQMPGMSGVECTAQLKRLLPSLQIMMLTVYEDADTIFKALRAGASGYLLKRSTPQEILAAVRDIRQGGAPMSSDIARKVVASFQKTAAGPGEKQGQLSPREEAVLDGLAKGWTYKQLASELGISIDTIRTYIRRIYEKLHVQSRTEAVAKYMRP